MYQRLLIIFSLLFVLNNQVLQAQDPIFTQPFATGIYLNPALAGSKEVARFAMNNRFQWLTAVDKLHSYHFSADMAFNRLGLGLSGIYNEEGTAFSFTNIGLSASYRLGNIQRLIVQPGLQLTYLNQRMNWDKLVFYDQLSPYAGKVSNYSKAMQSHNNANALDWSAGIVTLAPIDRFRSQPAWLDLGVAVHHLYENDLSQIGINEDIYPMRYAVHGGLLMPLFQKNDTTGQHDPIRMWLYPHFKYERQAEFNMIDIAAIAYWRPLLAGFGFRTFPDFYDFKNAQQLYAMIGFEGMFKKHLAYQLTYSIDFAYSGLSGKNIPAFHTHEVSLVILFSSLRQKNCIKDLGYKGRWFDSQEKDPTRTHDEARWFDPEKVQRRFDGECPPGKTPRKIGKDLKPVFYPYNLPVF